MKVLVTGANGFIGSHLVEFLAAQGHAVRCFVHQNFLPHDLEKSDRYEWYPGDLKDVHSIEGAVRGCDLVIHAGAISRYNAALPESEYTQVNVEGTRSVMEACLREGRPRFVFISSIEAVGVSSNGEPLTEESPPRPRNVYGRSKWEAEKIVNSFCAERKLDGVIIRIGTTYGPREKLIFGRFFKPIRTGFFPIFGNGSALIEFSYVKNQVQGIWQAATRGRAGETYFLSDERSYTLREVVEEIARQMGVRLRLIFVPVSLAWVIGLVCEALSRVFRFYPFFIKETGRAPFSRNTLQWTTRSTIFCSTAKAKEKLGYTAPYSLSDGLQETAHWYKEKGWFA